MSIQHFHEPASEMAAKLVSIRSVSGGEIISAEVLVPSVLSGAAPILALHGIGRDTKKIINNFSEAATRNQRLVVVPKFCKEKWPVFQRINRRKRPDKALLELMNTLQKMGLVGSERFDLFGYSGGAQLAHRFAMLYPEGVGKLHLGAAGWYTLPTEDLPYPLGLGPEINGNKRWGRRMSSALRAFLQRDITVYVGSEDIRRNRALYKQDALDEAQGRTRLERAQCYAAALRKAQASLNLTARAQLEIIDGCGHNFSQCSIRGDLGARICAA